MNFKDFFHQTLIKESPDTIYTMEGEIGYWTNPEKNFAFFILTNGQYIIMKESEQLYGHRDILDALKNPSHTAMDYALTDGDAEKLQPVLTNAGTANRGRIWTEHNRVSFWFPYSKNMIDPVTKMFKKIRISPVNYIFEMDGKSFQPGISMEGQSEAIMTWEEFRTGKEFSNEYKEELRDREYQKMQDQLMMSRQQIRAFRDGD